MPTLRPVLIGQQFSPLQFEELISTTIEETKEYPEIISETGKIGMPHKGTGYSQRLYAPLSQCVQKS